MDSGATPLHTRSRVHTWARSATSATTSDADDDDLTVTYDWYVAGSSVQDGTDDTLSGETYFDKDEEVYVIVTADDGTTTTSATSDSSSHEYQPLWYPYTSECAEYPTTSSASGGERY